MQSSCRRGQPEDRYPTQRRERCEDGDVRSSIGYRYVESILLVDEPVYVLGTVQEDAQIADPGDGSGEKKFIISYRFEEQLEERYRKDALALVPIAVSLFLLGAIFLGIGVAAAT